MTFSFLTFLWLYFVLGLFGEGPAERRERLKNLISRLSDDEIARKLRKKEEQEKKEEERENVCWTKSEHNAVIFIFIFKNISLGSYMVSRRKSVTCHCSILDSRLFIEEVWNLFVNIGKLEN